MKMQRGGIKEGIEDITAEASIDESHSYVTESDEECEIRILKWQFELILNTIEEVSG